MSNKAELQELEKRREMKRRCIPVKCIHHSALYLNKGEIGLASREELMHSRAYLKIVDVKDDLFDHENHKGYGKPLKRKAKEATDE